MPAVMTRVVMLTCAQQQRQGARTVGATGRVISYVISSDEALTVSWSHQQCEGVRVEGTVGGVVEAPRPRPCFDQPYQRRKPLINLHRFKDSSLRMCGPLQTAGGLAPAAG